MAINKYQDYLNSIMLNEVLKEDVAPVVTPKVEPVVQNATNTQTVGTLADLFKVEESAPAVNTDLGSQQMNNISDLFITGNARTTAATALQMNGIDTLRHPDANGMHFGNPFSPNPKSRASMIVPSIKDSVDYFKRWLQGDPSLANIEPERRAWIVNQINNGSLKGKPLVYYTNDIPDNSYGVSQYNSKTAPNHAHILLDMINNGITPYQGNDIAQKFYEVSTAGDKRFSALNARFKPNSIIFGQNVSGRTIESVYQHGVKQGDWITDNNYKTGKPLSKAIITGNTEDDSYTQGYLPLWKLWAEQNPDLIEDLRVKSKGMKLSDKYARTKVSQARALTEILANIPSSKQLLSNLANSSKGKLLPYEGIWTRDQVAKDPNNYYVFGDNTEDRLSGYVPSQTQAVIRGLPNAIGIDTKHNRLRNADSYFTDEYGSSPEYLEHLKTQQALINKVLNEGHNVYVPVKDGKLLIGAGKAELPIRAPKTYELLRKSFNIPYDEYSKIISDSKSKNFNNVTYLNNAQMNNIDFSLPKYVKPAKGVYVQDGQPLAYTLSKDKIVNGISYPKNTIFLNRLPEEDPIGYFMNYTQNSEQKKAVMNKLIQDGAIFSVDDIRQLLSNDKDAYRFLLWHEQSHVNNNDAEVYFKNGRDKMTPDKIDIETRATLDALNKLRAYKAYTNSKDLGEAQFKVISGGQTGIDILGVDEAYKLGIPTGGTIGQYPNNKYLIEAQDDLIDRTKYGFNTIPVTNPRDTYLARTEQNVMNSDGTIYFKDDQDSSGYIATNRYATRHNKPFLVNPSTPEEAYEWIKQNNIKTLNIAGNRGSKVSSEMRENTRQLLYKLYLSMLNKK